MFATVDNFKVKIVFSHNHCGGGDNTICALMMDKGNGWESVGEGVAYCHSSDNFNKEVGRKLSLERALWNAPFFSNITGIIFDPQTEETFRDRRRAIWNSYFSRSPKTVNRVVE
jgi:hypothetical protein